MKIGDLVVLRDNEPDLDFFADSKIWSDETMNGISYLDFEDLGLVLSIAKDKNYVEIFTNTGVKGWILTRVLEKVSSK